VTDTTTTLAKLTPRTEPAHDDDVTIEPDPPETPPKERSIPAGTIVRRGLQVFALAVVAFMIFALWLSGLAHARSQTGLQRKFRTELANNAAPVGGAIPTGSPVATLTIHQIGLTQTVVEGSRASQLRAGPGHVTGTPLPGQPGNAVIAGRRTLYGGPFHHLASLRPGDPIHVTTGEGTSTYRVTHIATLAAHDGTFVQEQGDNRLTLFTTDSPWNANGRLVVTATLTGNPYPPTNTQHALDPDGLGLTGERSAAPYLLVWLELLAVTALTSAYATTRWSPPRVWLVFAPILTVMIWLSFESFVRLLPATL